MTRPEWADDVLSFWFDLLKPEDWFEQKDATDEAIRSQFRDLHTQMQTAVPEQAYSDPDTALAAILLFDQFPRNMYRGTAEAFSTDNIAVALARNAVDKGLDGGVAQNRTMFFYMPFMHSEVLADQERCIALFAAAAADTKHAVEHRDIIATYGRFPHRNRALGRDNTEAETRFLGGHKGFGQ